MKFKHFYMAFVILSLSYVQGLCADVSNRVGPDLQRVSVNVLAGRDQGSGTIFLSLVEGEQSAWVLTANHVISGLREVSDVIDSDGTDKRVIRYADASIIQETVISGRTVGEVKYDAKIISVDKRRDIALMRVRRGDFTSLGARFYLGRTIPAAGTEIYHCGAPGGIETGGTCSLTGGIISRIGVLIPDFGGGSEYGVFDQTDAAALGGSSGGMIALKSDGRYVGMITLGLSGGDNFHWIVPARSILAWADEVGVRWLFDMSLKRPTEEDISEIVLEHTEQK
ncbi:MAG: trypsin-like peptidase domain-containing protein [bacterium]|nr:trypsin-like peptidase domain-containing protein [bacterium]